jgi:HPt (histidine-containing phosphotransfer) domain-containing protein
MTPSASIATFDPGPFIYALDGDHATVLELARTFLATYPQSLSAVFTAAAAGDRAALGERAHALKGSMAMLHADAMVRELEDIEAGCRDPGAELPLLVRSLAGTASAFSAEFDAFCARLTASVGTSDYLATNEGA